MGYHARDYFNDVIQPAKDFDDLAERIVSSTTENERGLIKFIAHLIYCLGQDSFNMALMEVLDSTDGDNSHTLITYGPNYLNILGKLPFKAVLERDVE